MVKVQLPAAASGLKLLQHNAHTAALAILAILAILEKRFCFVLWSTHNLRPFSLLYIRSMESRTQDANSRRKRVVGVAGIAD